VAALGCSAVHLFHGQPSAGPSMHILQVHFVAFMLACEIFLSLWACCCWDATQSTERLVRRNWNRSATASQLQQRRSSQLISCILACTCASTLLCIWRVHLSNLTFIHAFSYNLNKQRLFCEIIQTPFLYGCSLIGYAKKSTQTFSQITECVS
jgi:hypothetical protein